MHITQQGWSSDRATASNAGEVLQRFRCRRAPTGSSDGERERGTPTWRGYTYLDYVELLERLPRGNPKKEEKFKGIRRAENSFNRGYR